MSNNEEYREARAVFLAATKRLYVGGEYAPEVAANHDDIDEGFESFFSSPQKMPIRIEPTIVASLLDVLGYHKTSVESRIRKDAEDAFTYDNWDGSITVGYILNWRALVADRLEALETATGLKLRICYKEWTEEVSYRGDYSIDWANTDSE